MRYTITKSSLGSMLIAASEKGICAITFGNNTNELMRDLRNRFRGSEITRDDRFMKQHIRDVLSSLDQASTAETLPLDIQGTAFQKLVWKALRNIPHGRTATYAEIANRIGRPTAVRAVAQACAANPVAIAIPCHRVVRSDGSLSGYRWGKQRKAALLEREKEYVNG